MGGARRTVNPNPDSFISSALADVQCHRHKEEEHRREKEKMAHRRARSEGPASDYYDDRARGSSRGRRSIGRYDDAEDDYDSEEDYRRRQDDRKSHRRSRSRRDSRDYD